MDSRVAGQFGVERGCKHVLLSHGYGTTVAEAGENLDALPDRIDYGSTNEDPSERSFSDAVHFEVGLEAVDLAAEGVTAYLDVHEVERFGSVVGEAVGQDDHSGAGAPHGQSFSHESDDRVSHVEDVEELDDGRALPTGNDEAIQARQVLAEPHFGRVDSEPFDHQAMFEEIALNGKDSDSRQAYQPLTASCSSTGMVRTSRPGMASPRPRETSARTSGLL